MHRIHYSDSVLPGTAIAEALLDYAQALAEADTSATVEIPTMNDDGSPGHSQLLVGPASQLISEPLPPSHWRVESINRGESGVLAVQYERRR